METFIVKPTSIEQVVRLENLLSELHIEFEKEKQTIKTTADEFAQSVTTNGEPTKRISWGDFSFSESRKNLSRYKGSLADAVIEERRSAL